MYNTTTACIIYLDKTTLRIGCVQFFCANWPLCACPFSLSNSSTYRTWACRGGGMAPWPPSVSASAYCSRPIACSSRCVYTDTSRSVITPPAVWFDYVIWLCTRRRVYIVRVGGPNVSATLLWQKRAFRCRMPSRPTCENWWRKRIHWQRCELDTRWWWCVLRIRVYRHFLNYNCFHCEYIWKVSAKLHFAIAFIYTFIAIKIVSLMRGLKLDNAERK